ncbi:MAG: hypothetical protein EOM08_05130 [Clostridia bacterium]|nr:hypothetical protein [Clostridia bacterium]
MKKNVKIFLQFILWVMVISLIATPVWGKPLPNDRQILKAASQEFVIESVGELVNDNFADATILEGESGTATGHTYGATLEEGEPNPWPDTNEGDASVWWSWQAPSTGTYAFDSICDLTVDETNFIDVYSGSSLSALTSLAGNEYVDWDTDNIDRVVFKATAGTTYHIAVSAFQNYPITIDLAWSKVTPPANDDFANATSIGTASGTDSSSIWDATVEPDESYYLYDPGEGFVVNSIWYQWTAPTTGSFTFDTVGSGMKDTMLDVYAGTSFETLASLAHNDDFFSGNNWSNVLIDATEGSSYYICVTGYWGCKGPVTLNWYANEAPVITSLNEATFTVGSSGTFTVTATGIPDPDINLNSGSLPAGVSYTSSTKTLSGTPAMGTGGVYNLVFTAVNGTGNPSMQNFTLTVQEAPSFTSTNQATFLVGIPASHTIVTHGYPAPSVELTSGSLPAGVTYDSTTRRLSGTVTDTAGTYPLVFTASNGIGAPATQNFWLLTLYAAPEITEQPHSMMATTSDLAIFSVTATGSPVLSYQWQVCTSTKKNTWSDLAGATESVYITPQATLKMDGYQYRVIISNSAGSILSNPATLTVFSAPTSQSNVEVEVIGAFDSVSQNIEWPIGVHSLGPQDAEGVQVTCTLGKFTRFVSVDLSSIPGATYKVQGSKVIVDLGTLSGDCDFTLTTNVGRATSPTVLTVSASTTSFDTDLANNSATYEVTWP